MSCNKEKANATDIVNKLLDLYPYLKRFLEILVKDINIEINKVGEDYKYPVDIDKNKEHTYYGLFMDYFIRKHLSDKFKIILCDNAAEIILNNKRKYFGKKYPEENRQLKIDITSNYKIYKDNQQKAMDILDTIKIVALATTIFSHDPLPTCEIKTKIRNLREIIKYFEKLPYTSVDMKTNVNCEYFNGNADLIFDSKILYEIKTSKFKFLKRTDSKFNVNNFYKLILYGFGYYKKTNQIIKCYKIYNPLLGLEYTLRLEDIDMKRFEKVLKKDTDNILKK